jgi:acetyltransferase-like isoleucine patch superfamily enzyme
MNSYERDTADPEVVMHDVTVDIIRRAIPLARKKHRTIAICKTARGKGVDIATLDPRTADGAQRLAAFLNPVQRHYTFSGLGAPEEPNAINWRAVCLPFWRRVLLLFQVAVSFVLKGTPFKNRWYRWMGAHIGRNVEIMQMVWLDHFRPELIFIGDNTLVGAFSQMTVHAYEGCGTFRYGLIEIGANCKIGAGTGIGPMKIEDGVRTLPGTTLSPYLVRVRAGAVVGYAPPPMKLPESPPASANAAADTHSHVLHERGLQ